MTWYNKGRVHLFLHADSRGGSSIIQAPTKDKALADYAKSSAEEKADV